MMGGGVGGGWNRVDRVNQHHHHKTKTNTVHRRTQPPPHRLRDDAFNEEEELPPPLLLPWRVVVVVVGGGVGVARRNQDLPRLATGIVLFFWFVFFIHVTRGRTRRLVSKRDQLDPHKPTFYYYT